MASPASATRKAAPARLRIIEGRGVRKDGIPTDSGGRPIEQGPNFTRSAPVKPDDLSADASAVWDLAVAEMEVLGLLKPLDGPALRIGCESYARWREAVRYRQKFGLLAENSQGRVTAPWIGIEERAGREFRSWAAEFGFTPAAEKALAGGVADVGQSGDNPF